MSAHYDNIFVVCQVFCAKMLDTVGFLIAHCSYICSNKFFSESEVQIVCIGPADATAIPKPHHLLPHLIPDWFYLSDTSLPRFPGKEAVKRV